MDNYNNFLKYDELENAIDNLEMVSFFLNNFNGERMWKWAIIAIHQALYGFAICASTPTDSRFALKDPKNYESKLISIWEAIKRAKIDEWMKWNNSIKLETSLEEDSAIERLVSEFRNGFEHFRPQSWLIEIEIMPKMFTHVLRVIQHLAIESNQIVYFDDILKERTTKAINNLKVALEIKNSN